jgi:hypothetical protein
MLIAALRPVPADVVAVIPDEVDLPAQRGEFLATGGILDAETEGFIELGLFLGLAPLAKFLHTSKLGTNTESVNWSVTSMVNTWWTTKPAPPRVGALYPRPERRGFTAQVDNYQQCPDNHQILVTNGICIVQLECLCNVAVGTGGGTHEAI